VDFIGPFRGATYFMSLYYRSRFHYTLPTNELEYDFPTAQHAIEAAKCPTAASARSLLNTAGPDPKLARRYGQSHVTSPLYHSIYYPMLEEILALKFPLNSNDSNFTLSQRLIETGERYIVYFNYWHDNNLGVCACTRCGAGANGLNMLGLLLMDRRDTLLRNLGETL
jgi:predicted NAD-dependent protein-ADP-ribosyltransferase YbiA (DUF1768 family)